MLSNSLINMAGIAITEGLELLSEVGSFLGELTTGSSSFARGYQAFTGTAVATEQVVDAAVSSLVNSNTKTNMGVVKVNGGKKVTPAVRKRPTIIKPSPENPGRRISTGPSVNMQSGGNTDEVPLVPPPRKISKIVQDYTTIKLPWYQLINLDTTNTNANAINIRLNSVYDPIVGSATNRQPQGRDAFAQNYQYYRVIESKVHAQWHYSGARVGVITFGSPSTITGNPMDSTYVVGWETQNGETDAITSAVDAFMVTKHAHRQLLLPGNAGYTGTDIHTEGVSVATTDYQYTPQGFIQQTGHVQNISKSEFWTPVGENPEHRHILALRTYGIDNQALIVNSIRLLLTIEYTVQFREYANSAIKTLDTGDATYNTGEGKTDTIDGA